MQPRAGSPRRTRSSWLELWLCQPGRDEAVLSLGVSPDRIIYSNPCKAVSHIKYAASVGVNLTTFDSREDLENIRKWHSKCDLLLRVKAPENSVITPLGGIYGAVKRKSCRCSKQLKLRRSISLASLSLSEAEPRSCGRTLEPSAKTVFNAAAQLGLRKLRMLNVNGGFTANPHFDEPVSIVK